MNALRAPLLLLLFAALPAAANAQQLVPSGGQTPVRALQDIAGSGDSRTIETLAELLASRSSGGQPAKDELLEALLALIGERTAPSAPQLPLRLTAEQLALLAQYSPQYSPPVVQLPAVQQQLAINVPAYLPQQPQLEPQRARVLVEIVRPSRFSCIGNFLVNFKRLFTEEASCDR